MADSKDPLALRAKSAMAKQADDYLAKSLNYYQSDIEAMVGPLGMDYQRFRSQVLLSVYQNPDILQADGKSFVLAVLRAAECGLSLAPTLGLAYLVPFKEKGTPKVQLIVGYKGLVYSAVRAGMAQAIRAQVVRKEDAFEYEEGAFEVLRHRPDPRLSEEARGDVIGAYAVAILGPELRRWEFMPRSEIDRIESSSRAASNPSGPWKLHKPEMQKKTAARRLCKWLQAAPDVPAHKAAALERTLETVDAEWTNHDDALPKTMAPGLPEKTATPAETIEPSRVPEVVGPTDPEPPPPTDADAPRVEIHHFAKDETTQSGQPDEMAMEIDALRTAIAAASKMDKSAGDKALDALNPRLKAIPKGEDRDALGRAVNAARAACNGRT